MLVTVYDKQKSSKDRFSLQANKMLLNLMFSTKVIAIIMNINKIILQQWNRHIDVEMRLALFLTQKLSHFCDGLLRDEWTGHSGHV